MSGAVISCVGAVIRDDQGRLLLVKRGHAPGAGLWSLPGGRIEPGETAAEALVREMREETGLEVEPGPLLGTVRRPAGGGDVIDIRDYAATVTGGTLTPGDDATGARWVSVADLGSLAVTEGLIEALTDWGVLGQDGIDRPLHRRRGPAGARSHHPSGAGVLDGRRTPWSQHRSSGAGTTVR